MGSFTVGLIGGIGSGKTAVSNGFERLGVTIADTDVASRTIMEPGREALIAIRDHFGDRMIAADGTLDRPALREVVFNDPEQRRWLERLTHPLILKACWDIIAASTAPYSLLVLSTGSGRGHQLQRMLAVDVPESVQVERTMARDGNSRELVESIIRAQASRADRLNAADDVIVNDAGLDELEARVAALHAQYVQLAKEQAA